MENRKGKPILKKIILIAACCVVGIGFLILGTEAWLGFKIRNRIAKEITAATGGTFSAKIGQANLNLFNRNVNLKDISIKSNDSLLSERGGSLKSLSVEIKQLIVQDVRLSKNEGKVLSVGEVNLIYPRIVLGLGHADAETDSISVPKPDVREQIGQMFREITIGRIVIRNGDVEYCDHRNDKKHCYSVNGLSLETDNFDLDVSDTLKKSLLEKDIRASVNHLSYSFDEESMLLEIDTVAFSTGKGLFSVAKIKLLPQYAKNEFASLSPGHTDWTQVISGPLAAYGVDYPGLIEHKTLKIDSLSIGRTEVGSYKNRQIAQRERVKPLFYESLQKFPLKIDIRRINLGRIDAQYEELAVNGKTPGTVTFDSISGDFYGLTNIVQKDRPYYTLEARGKLMGQGEVTATFRLPVDSLTNRFEVKGTLGPMDMLSLNRVVEPLVHAKIDSGRIESMDFSIVGSALKSEGKVLLRYDGLNVVLLKNDAGKLRERKLLTAIVDEILIRHSNPDNKNLRTGAGTMERDLYRSQFNYLWKSLLPGIKQTVISRAPGRKTDRDRYREKREERREQK